STSWRIPRCVVHGPAACSWAVPALAARSVHWRSHPVLEQSDILVRILAGALLGATIGYEREVRARAAGLRTHLLVGLAASTFMVLSTEFPHWQSESVTAKYVVPSRIAAAVVAGIGF